MQPLGLDRSSVPVQGTGCVAGRHQDTADVAWPLPATPPANVYT